MSNMNTRISKIEKMMQKDAGLLPAILHHWMEEEVEELRAAFGGEFPVVVIINDIPDDPPAPPRPARPLKELIAEFNRLTRPLPKGWQYAKK